MGHESMLCILLLAVGTSCSSALKTPKAYFAELDTGPLQRQRHASLLAFGHLMPAPSSRLRSYSIFCSGECNFNGAFWRPQRRQGVAAVMMVSERQEELKEKIAKLRRVTAKGDGYERIVGSGADLTEKMEKSKDDFESDSDKAQQEKIREGVVVKGKKENAVSELEEGRRTIVRDPDDPAFESNILDSLMVSRQDEIEAERDVIYRPASETSTSEPPQEQKRSFEGAFGTTMGDAEAFFNKPSPFTKAAEEEKKKAKASLAAKQNKARASLAAAQDAMAAAAAYAAEANSAVGGVDGGAAAVLSDSVPGSDIGGGVAVEEDDVDADQNTAGADAEAEAAVFEKLTGSVGGRWEKPAEGTETDTHKPVVSTWGVFERPKDISKAYGGGRDPTLRSVDPKERRRRDEETQAILRSYRGTSEEDIEREKNNEEEIKAALAQAKRAMRFGDAYGAVSSLEGIKQDCSTHGPLGAVVFLELAMALEMTGRTVDAENIYKVLRRSKNREVGAQAKRLLEGVEALQFMKYALPGEEKTVSEVSKMWKSNYQQVSKKYDKCYETGFFEKDADGKPKGANVFDVKDAKEVLLFANKYRGGISSKRVIKAFEFLGQRSKEAAAAAQREAAARLQEQEEASPVGVKPQENSAGASEPGGQRQDDTDGEIQGGAGLVALMGDVNSLGSRVSGEWCLAIKAVGSKVDLVRGEGILNLGGGGVLNAVEPAGPVSVSKQGEWELNARERRIKLTYNSSKLVGLVDIGRGKEELDLVALDDQLLVASTGRGGVPVLKYRLFVRKNAAPSVL